MELGLADKVCIVTGSARGIGRLVAEQLRAEGAIVVTSGREDDGPGDLHVGVDLADRDGAGRLVGATVERYGRVDGLVNNVGGTDTRTFAELTDDDWRNSFELNLMSAVRTTREALPHMGRGSAIVNVSSRAAKRPATGMPDYAVMKAALLSYSRLVSDLHAKDGVRCNAVTPGPASTDAEPDETAAVVVFLLSDRASSVTGAAWSADGGTVPIII